MATIQFTNIPSTGLRNPGVFFEVDASQANTGQVDQRTLLVGQKLSSGAAPANIPFLASSLAQVQQAAGIGSMLEFQYTQYLKSDPYGEIWIGPVDDNGSGVAFVGAATFAGTATAAGAVSIYIKGHSYQVKVSSGDTAANVATALAATVTKILNAPVTAVVDGSNPAKVNLTSKHKGSAAGDIDVRFNYLGAANAEVFPAGITATYAITTVGSLDPVLDTLYGNLGKKTFDFICVPYNTTAAITSTKAMLSDVTGRWNYVNELFGGSFGAFRGTAGDIQTFLSGVNGQGAINNQHMTVLCFYDSPSASYEVAADYTAVCANSLRNDPAMPLQNITMNWLAPPLNSTFSFAMQNTFLFNAGSTFDVTDDGSVVLRRAVTTYMTNNVGAPDNSYLDVETLYTLAFLIRLTRIALQSKFSRKKLVSDGTRVPGGSNFVTSKTVLAEAIAQYQIACASGIAQDFTTFARTARSENAGGGRVNLLLPFNCANQLRQVAVLAQFIKS